MNGRQFKFENAMASVAGAAMRGTLDLDLASAPRVNGEINADTIDAAAILGGIAGMPQRARPTRHGRPSLSRPDGSAALSGQITVERGASQ